MRLLLVVGCLSACDPGWHVRNVATASPTTKTDAACIEAGLRATGYTVKKASSDKATAIEWYVDDPKRAHMRVNWDPRKATAIELMSLGVGTAPPAGAVENYRTMREATVAKLTETCGPFQIGPEDCMRVNACAPPAK
jgi:hypothetical protein